jgi:SAM-dependent methyltransferase
VVAYDLPDIFANKWVRKRVNLYGINAVGSKIAVGRRFHLPFKCNSFDFVFMTEVIEHLNFSPVFLIKEIHRVLKSSGLLVLTTPNVHSLENKIKFLFNKSIYGNLEKYLYNEPYDHHWREFDQKELSQILTNNKFTIFKTFYCNDILINRYNTYLYKTATKLTKAYLKRLLYLMTVPLQSYKKQIILFAFKN